MHLPAFWAVEAAAMVAVAGATADITTVAAVAVATVAAMAVAMAATADITPVAAVAVATVAAMAALARAVATRPLRPPLPLRLLPPPLRPLLRLRHPPSNFGVDLNTASNRQCL